jgi:hypothetical protein
MKLNRVLMLNMSGEDVKFMQSKLKDHGFLKGSADGYFGQITLVSIVNFQKAVGIKSDGVVGMMTWNKLIGYDPNPPLLKDPVIMPAKNDIPFKASYIGQNGFTIYDCLLNDNEYFKEEVKKETIWLHHTAGGSRPDFTIGGWEKDFLKNKKGDPILDKNGNMIPLKVGTQYIIGRKSSSTGDSTWDGKILKAFDDKYWAYHLGLNSPKNDELNSKSIAIEICNYGQLSLGKDGVFYNYVNKPVMESEVVEVNFRGYKYWEKYTDNQIESLRKIILYLKNKWGIEIQNGIYNETWFDYNKIWFENGGIRSHTQVRTDKYDLFPQKEMMQMLNSL